MTANEKVLKMLKMAYDKLQILAGTSLPFFISFNTVLYAVASTTLHSEDKKKENNFLAGIFNLKIINNGKTI